MTEPANRKAASDQEPSRMASEGCVAPWLLMYQLWQFDTNCLASVAIEVPALRPVLERRLRAFGD